MVPKLTLQHIYIYICGSCTRTDRPYQNTHSEWVDKISNIHTLLWLFCRTGSLTTASSCSDSVRLFRLPNRPWLGPASWSGGGPKTGKSNSHGEHAGENDHRAFPKSTVIQMGGVLRYEWEAHCDTNRRGTDSISLSSERRGTKSTAIQTGGVLWYKLEVYFDTLFEK